MCSARSAAEAALFLRALPEELGMLEAQGGVLRACWSPPPSSLVFDASRTACPTPSAGTPRASSGIPARQPQGTVLYIDTKEDA